MPQTQNTSYITNNSNINNGNSCNRTTVRCTQTAVVREKFDAKKFSSLVWHDKNWTNEIILTMNKKVMFLFIGDYKGRKYYTKNKFHMKISSCGFFKNYGSYMASYVCNQWLIKSYPINCIRSNNASEKCHLWMHLLIRDCQKFIM